MCIASRALLTTAAGDDCDNTCAYIARDANFLRFATRARIVQRVRAVIEIAGVKFRAESSGRTLKASTCTHSTHTLVTMHRSGLNWSHSAMEHAGQVEDAAMTTANGP